MSASSKKKLRKEQNAAQLTEKQLNEQKEAKKLKTYTVVFSVIMILVVVAGLITAAASAYKSSGIIERNTLALTVGKNELDSADLNYYFINAVNNQYNEWNNQYGDYTSLYLQMMGLDMTKPLNTQMYDGEKGISYADYFAEIAVKNAAADYTLYDQATAAGEGLTEEEKAVIDESIKSVADFATKNGYGSTKAYLKTFYGNGANEKNYRQFLEVYALAQRCRQEKYDGLTFEETEVEAYNTEHFDELSSFTYCSLFLQPSDFLECTADEDDTTHQHTDEENEAALANAEAAAKQLAASGADNALTFDQAIAEIEVYAESEKTCTQNKRELYLSIKNTNEDVAKWLADKSRVDGDMTVITSTSTITNSDGTETTSTLGYYVLLFRERHDNYDNLVNVRHILTSFQGGTTDETTGAIVYSEAEKKLALDTLTQIQTNWELNPTEENFAALANANSTDPGSNTNGGLYENVYPGQMVDSFNDWCFDEARKAGDYGIVETEYGYHLIYFVKELDMTYRDYMIDTNLRNKAYNEWYTDLIEQADSTTHDLSKLTTGITLAS